MPHPTPLTSGDPTRVAGYQLTARLAGIPSDDPIFLGAGPDGTEVAISILSGGWARDAAARDRFAAEAAVARNVPPFCAARVLDAGFDGSTAYLVSEYIAGQSLLELIAAYGVRRGHDLEAVAIGMATGLASVHQAGLVHGSFGPEFVILAPDGSPRVVEFGITPPYGAATPSADMVAWAQTVVFAASGRPPAARADLNVLPDPLRATVEHCLDPQSAGQLSARTVVRSLLGSQDLPAGLLAEGSRRAARPGRGGYDQVRGGFRQPGQADTRIPPGPPAGTPATGRRAALTRVASTEASTSGTTAAPAAPTGPGASRHTASAADSPDSPWSRTATSHAASGHAASGHAAPGHAASGHAASGRAASGHAAPGHAQGRPSAVGRPGSRHSADSLPVRHARSGIRRGRRAGWLIGAAVVVIVVGGLLLHVLLGGSHARKGLLSADTDKTRSTPSPTASATPSRGPVTPAAFGGSWSGVVTQPPTDTYHVGVVLAAGTTAGTIRYSGPGFSCSGVLTLTTASSRDLTMSQVITGRSSCEDGQVTISRTGPNRISFSFHSSGPTASGSLVRSSS